MHSKLYMMFFTILNQQAGRALKFEGNCRLKQTKKHAARQWKTVCKLFFTTNLNRQASEQVFVLHDSSRQLHTSEFITAGGELEMRTVAFYCKKLNCKDIFVHFKSLLYS